jgi:hypothetical protein
MISFLTNENVVVYLAVAFIVAVFNDDETNTAVIVTVNNGEYTAKTATAENIIRAMNAANHPVAVNADNE